MEIKDVRNQLMNLLESKGSSIYREAKEYLLKNVTAESIREPLEYTSKTYTDLLRPALIVLSCESVGIKPRILRPIAVTMTLIGMALYLFDDIIDRTESRCFKPTTTGRFGAGTALITGGLITAKAFTILNQTRMQPEIRKRIIRVFWSLLYKMSVAETMNLKLRRERRMTPQNKFKIMKMRSINIEACTKIGAILGHGSNEEINHLAKYGRYLGTILELTDDLTEALNLTLELEGRIKSGSWPYAIIWAEAHSENVGKIITTIMESERLNSHLTQDLIKEMIKSGTITHIRKKICKYIKKARGELKSLKHSDARKSLEFIVEASLSLIPT